MANRKKRAQRRQAPGATGPRRASSLGWTVDKLTEQLDDLPAERAGLVAGLVDALWGAGLLVCLVASPDESAEASPGQEGGLELCPYDTDELGTEGPSLAWAVPARSEGPGPVDALVRSAMLGAVGQVLDAVGFRSEQATWPGGPGPRGPRLVVVGAGGAPVTGVANNPPAT